MGFLSWVGAGLVIAIACRFIKMGRRSIAAELFTAAVVAAAAGLTATALDFGGWSELDPRAIGFAALAALTSIGALRLLRRRSSTRAR